MGGVAGAEKERKGLQPKMGFGMMWLPQENRPWTGLCHGGCVVRECIFLAQPVPVTGNVRNRSQGSHHNWYPNTCIRPTVHVHAPADR